MPEFGVLAWIVLGLAGVCVGLSKTAIPGIGSVTVVLFAAVLPAKESTGTLLILLILADVVAILSYRRHADWGVLVRLIPAVLVGLLAGVACLAVTDNELMRRIIGVILLALIVVTLARRRLAAGVEKVGSPRLASAVYGSLGGFTTMVANAGGPVMSMYFLASGFSVTRFLGTAAWFFAAVNLTKLPFSIALGLVTPEGLLLDAVLAPLVLIGAFAGRWIATRIDQVLFDRLVIVFTAAGAIYLLF